MEAQDSGRFVAARPENAPGAAACACAAGTTAAVSGTTETPKTTEVEPPTTPEEATPEETTPEETTPEETTPEETTPEETTPEEELFPLARSLDSRMRDLLDEFFDVPVCEALFGSMNLFASAGGLPVWANLLLALTEEAKYTAKYKK